MKNFNRLSLYLGLVFVAASLALAVFSAHSLQAAIPSTVTKHTEPLPDGSDQDKIPFTTGSDHIYHVAGNLDISKKQSGGQTGVVFVDGNLHFSGDYKYGTDKTGAVFVVKGDVNIDTSVTQVDAVIISEGTICTAYNGTPCPSTNVSALQLVINGSLISLNPDKPIKFRRTLSDNSQPAEIINHQVKYLVILRDLLSDTYQKWSEIP